MTREEAKYIHDKTYDDQEEDNGLSEEQRMWYYSGFRDALRDVFIGLDCDSSEPEEGIDK